MYVCLFDLFIHSFIHSEYFYSASLSHRLCLSFLSQPVSASHVTGCLSLRPQPVSASPQTVYAYRYALVFKGLTDWLELLVSDCNIGSSLNKSKVSLLLHVHVHVTVRVGLSCYSSYLSLLSQPCLSFLSQPVSASHVTVRVGLSCHSPCLFCMSRYAKKGSVRVCCEPTETQMSWSLSRT